MRPSRWIIGGLAAAVLSIAPALAERPQSTDGEPWFGKSPLGAGVLSDLIQEGDVSPGEDYTIEVGGRFHRVHSKLMAISCEGCHANVKFPADLQYLRREEFPLAAYPGAVDRGICLGCHRGSGALATPYYVMPGQ
jgi:hypothetical protein